LPGFFCPFSNLPSAILLNKKSYGSKCRKNVFTIELFKKKKSFHTKKEEWDNEISRVGFSFRPEGVYIHLGVGHGYNRFSGITVRTAKQNTFGFRYKAVNFYMQGFRFLFFNNPCPASTITRLIARRVSSSNNCTLSMMV